MEQEEERSIEEEEEEYDLNWYWDYDKEDWVRCDPEDWQEEEEERGSCTQQQPLPLASSVSVRNVRQMMEEGSAARERRSSVDSEKRLRTEELQRMMRIKQLILYSSDQ